MWTKSQWDREPEPRASRLCVNNSSTFIVHVFKDSQSNPTTDDSGRRRWTCWSRTRLRLMHTWKSRADTIQRSAASRAEKPDVTSETKWSLRSRRVQHFWLRTNSCRPKETSSGLEFSSDNRRQQLQRLNHWVQLSFCCFSHRRCRATAVKNRFSQSPQVDTFLSLQSAFHHPARPPGLIDGVADGAATIYPLIK